MLKTIIEGKYDENEKFIQICNRLRDEIPEFSSLDNGVLKKILSLFWKCTGYWWNDTKEDHPVDEIMDKFYDWFSEFDGVGDLILSNFNSKKGSNKKFVYDKARGMNAFSGPVLYQLIKEDPRFQQALVMAARKLGLIDREGYPIYSISDADPRKIIRGRVKATVAQLIQWLFIEGGENTDQEKVKKYLDDHPELGNDIMNIPMDDKTNSQFIYKDRDMYEDMMQVIADEFYNLSPSVNSCQLELGDFNKIGKFNEEYVPMAKRLSESSEKKSKKIKEEIKEENSEEETVKEESTEDEIGKEEETELSANEEESLNDVSSIEDYNNDMIGMSVESVPNDNSFETEDNNEALIKGNVKSLTDALWRNINQTKQFISLLDDASVDNKKDIISILNGFVDDLVINIGMLNKVNDLFNSELADLIDQGKQKASKLINSKPSKKDKKEEIEDEKLDLDKEEAKKEEEE